MKAITLIAFLGILSFSPQPVFGLATGKLSQFIAPLECVNEVVNNGVTVQQILTPEQCDELLNPPPPGQDGGDPLAGLPSAVTPLPSPWSNYVLTPIFEAEPFFSVPNGSLAPSGLSLRTIAIDHGAQDESTISALPLFLTLSSLLVLVSFLLARRRV